MGGPRWLAIALAVLVVGGLAVWGIVEATSSGGDGGGRYAGSVEQERAERRIERLERLLIAIDRAGRPGAQAARERWAP